MSAHGLATPEIENYTVNENGTVTLSGTAADNSTVTVYDGQTSIGTTTASASGAWTYVTGTLAHGTQVFTTTATNAAGNTSTSSNPVDAIIGQAAGPALVSVVSSGTGITDGNGDLSAGSVVTLTLNMSEAVAVAGGTPTLTLDDDGTATYVGGSGSDTLTFSYTVAAGQNTPDLTVTAVNLNGATITHGAGNNADLSGTLTPAGTLQIDTTSPIILTPNNPQYNTDGPWSAYAGAWAAGSLVYGVDYTQSIEINDQTFPDGTLISWSWPMTAGPYGVYSYPTIVYGSTPELINPTVQSTQVANFANLSTSYSITLSGDTNGFDTIFDMWLTSQPNGDPTTQQYELEIVAHTDWTPPASAIAYTLTDSTLQNATVYVIPGYNDDGVTWTNITVMPSSDILAGTISISDILKSLIWNGVITGQEYISGVEFGPEPGWGSGSLLISNLSYQWDGTPTVELTPGNNTLQITTPGGNDVEGNGGTDTVIYNGIYAQFQIKSSGAETLVTENNNISTLDYLQGITYIQFANGTYDTLTSIFTPSGPAVTSVAISGTGITSGDGDLTVSLPTPTWNQIDGGTPTVMAGGNFEGLSAAQLAVSETGGGTYIYLPSSGAWTKIDGGVYSLMAAGDFYGTSEGNNGNTDLAACDPGVGTYIWSNGSGWVRIDTGTVTALAAGDFNGGTTAGVVASESGAGTYLWAYGVGWTKIGGGVYSMMAAGDFYGTSNGNAGNTDLAAYDPGVGTYIWSANAGWTKIDTGNATEYAAGNFLGTSNGNNNNADLAVYFPGSGTYIWSATGSWIKIDSGTATGLAAVDLNGNGQNELLAYFPNAGMYEWQSGVGWSKYDATSTLPATTQSPLFAEGNFQGGAVVDAAVGFTSTAGIWLDPPGVSSASAVPAPVTVGNGASVDLNTPSAAAVTFAGGSGTLQLDQSAAFSGTITGFGGQDQLDLTDIAFSANSTLGYSANSNNSGGGLTVSDGIHMANIALLGSYMASSFVTSSDGHGGTLIGEAAQITFQTTPLAQPHAPG